MWRAFYSWERAEMWECVKLGVTDKKYEKEIIYNTIWCVCVFFLFLFLKTSQGLVPSSVWEVQKAAGQWGKYSQNCVTASLLQLIGSSHKYTVWDDARAYTHRCSACPQTNTDWYAREVLKSRGTCRAKWNVVSWEPSAFRHKSSYTPLASFVGCFCFSYTSATMTRAPKREVSHSPDTHHTHTERESPWINLSAQETV